MKVHNYTLWLFGLLLWKEKEKKNKFIHKIWHKSVSFFSFSFFFFFASQWFQNHFVLAVWKRLLTHPVTKSTSEVNRMRVPIEAQRHAMLFAILKPRLQDDRSCQQDSFVSCVAALRCASNMQYYFLAGSFNLFFAFSFHLSFGFFQANFSWVFFFFLVFLIWWASAFFAECKNDP